MSRCWIGRAEGIHAVGLRWSPTNQACSIEAHIGLVGARHEHSVPFVNSRTLCCSCLVFFSPLPLLRPRPPSLPPSLSATSDFLSYHAGCRPCCAVETKQNKTKRSRLTRPTGQATRTALSPPWPPPSRRSSADPNARATTTAAAAAEERRRHSVT